MKNLLKLTTPFILIGLTACGGGGSKPLSEKIVPIRGGFKPLSEKVITSPHPAAKNMGIELNCKTGAVRLNRSRSDLPELNVDIWYEYDEFIKLTAKNTESQFSGKKGHEDIAYWIGQYCTRNPGEL